MKVTFIQPLVVRLNTAKQAVARSIDLPEVPAVGDYVVDKFVSAQIEKIRVNLDTQGFECIVTSRPFESSDMLKKFLDVLPNEAPGWKLI